MLSAGREAPQLVDLNRSELSDALGKSLRTIDAWREKGCPAEMRIGCKGRPEYQFNLAAVLEWYGAERERRGYERGVESPRNEDYDEARARKTAAEATLREIDVQKARGLLANIETVADALEREHTAVREHFLNIPGKLAGRLSPADVQLVEDEIHEALQQFSDSAELVSGVTGEGVPGHEAADLQATTAA
jgi:phage terminase Nu1 subunit (DNA packaging protein)